MVKHYRAGDFFGELALLSEAKRAANVVAASQVAGRPLYHCTHHHFGHVPPASLINSACGGGS